MIKKLTFITLLLLGAVLNLSGATYYVNNTGSVTCNNTFSTAQAQSQSTPWCDFGKASTTMVAGDTAIMLNGSYYGSTIVPTNNGSVGNPITFVGSAQPTAGGTNATVRNFNLTGKQYITLKFLEMTDNGTGFSSTSLNRVDVSGSTGVVLDRNYIHDGAATNQAIGATTSACTDLTLFGNVIKNIGAAQARKAGLGMFCNNTLVDGNAISHVGDFYNLKGTIVVMRNNDLFESPGYDSVQNHVDGIQADCQSGSTPGIAKILLEGNHIYNTEGTVQQHFLLSNSNGRCGGLNKIITRYNTCNDIGEGFYLQNNSQAFGIDSKIYNNTVVRCAAPLSGSVASISSVTNCTSSSPTSSIPTAAGTGFTLAGNYPTSAISGSGTGLTVDVTLTGDGVALVIIHSYGSGYIKNDQIRITGGNNDATFYICGVENTSTAVSLTGALQTAVINNIFVDSVTNTSNLNLLSFGSGRILTYGSTLVGGTGYVTAESLSATGTHCQGVVVNITAVAGAITVVTVTDHGITCQAGDVLTVVQSGGSGGTFTVDSLYTEDNVHKNNLAYLTVNPAAAWITPFGGATPETGRVITSPLFTDATSTFTLQPSSPALNTGAALTTVEATDTGTGTSLVVHDAAFFQPGWAGTTADCIAVGTVTNTACITDIDYDADIITLGTSITRSNGDSVWLYSKSDGTRVLYGTAPEIGAYETTDSSPTVSVGTITVSQVTISSLRLSWSAASDETDPTSSLRYEVCRSTSNNITSVANCEANGTLVMSLTANTLLYVDSNLSPNTTYYYNVVVADLNGNKTAYTPVSQTTSAVSSTSGSSVGGSIRLRSRGRH